MPQYRHPGVYVQEVDGPMPIQGVATDIAAFVGVAERGDYDTPTLVTGWDQYNKAFGGFLWDRYLSYAVYDFFAQGGSTCYIVRARPEPFQEPIKTELKGSSGAVFTVAPTSQGPWGKLLSILLTNYPDSAAPTTKTPLFNLTVLYSSTFPITWNNLATVNIKERLLQEYILNNGIQPVVGMNDDGTQIIGYYYFLERYMALSLTNPNAKTAADLQVLVQKQLDQAINNISVFIRVEAKITALDPKRPDNILRPQQLGANAAVSNYVFANQATNQGIYTLTPLEDLSILAIPDLSGYLKADGSIDGNGIRNIAQEALTYCQNREDLFYVIDPPPEQSITNIMDFKQATGAYSGQAFNSSFGALYYPWIAQLELSSKRQVYMPPSGSVVGIYANTDHQVGVYKAPAGTQDGRVLLAVGLETIVTNNDQDLLNPIGVNAIRNLYQIGIVVWGARTVSANPAWIYVNVRRLLIYIEKSLKRASQAYVFEPNAMTLWAQISRDFTDFLTVIWREGALFGNTAAEAFYVVVDESNNPPETRDRGELYIDVGVAPVKPAEFIVIRISQSLQSPS